MTRFPCVLSFCPSRASLSACMSLLLSKGFVRPPISADTRGELASIVRDKVSPISRILDRQAWLFTGDHHKQVLFVSDGEEGSIFHFVWIFLEINFFSSYNTTRTRPETCRNWRRSLPDSRSTQVEISAGPKTPAILLGLVCQKSLHYPVGIYQFDLFMNRLRMIYLLRLARPI